MGISWKLLWKCLTFPNVSFDFPETSPSCELKLNKNRHVYDDEDDKQYNLTANKKNDRTLRALVFPICLLSDSYCVLFVLLHKYPKNSHKF